MEDFKVWLIIVITTGTLIYSVVSTYAIRGNELKHLKAAIKCLESKLLKRIERLENLFMTKENKK